MGHGRVGERAPVTFFLLPFSFFLLGALQQPAPPPLLLQGLKSTPDVRLLAPATDLREYSQAQLQKFGYWPPWLVLDLDRDKRPDVAAVVVKPSKTGAEFGVVVVHAATPNEVQWVVPLDTEAINGVTKGPAPDTLVPLFCVECDLTFGSVVGGNTDELYAIDETIDIVTETQAICSSTALQSRLENGDAGGACTTS